MKRFAFRFQSVAKVRKIEMERQARILAEAQMRVRQIEEEIESIKKMNRLEVERLQSLAGKGQIPAQMMELSVMYREELKREHRRKMIALREAEAKVREEREKLIEREKARKVMEKVRERDFENYVEDKRKEENKQIDELAHRFASGGDTHSES